MSANKKWLDLQGRPTEDDSKTHWDEEGCLEIREEMDESGQDTDIEVLRSDQVTEIGVPIAKSPADLRKLMESV